MSRELGVPDHVIRFWQASFPQVTLRKNASGHRIFNQDDRALLHRIKFLLYEEKLTIEGAKQRLTEEKEPASVSLAPQTNRPLANLTFLAEVKKEVEGMINLLDEDPK
jgi:DNA-binding transcriptional MerR regulator